MSVIDAIYNKLVRAIAMFIIVVGGAVGWSFACAKIALILFYGSKAKWDKIYVVTDVPTYDPIMGIVVSAFYDVVSGPTSVIALNLAECRLNHCRPDIVVSTNEEFVKEVDKRYPLSSIPISVILHAKTARYYNSDNNQVVVVNIWDTPVIIAIPKVSKQGLFAKTVIKMIAADEILRKYAVTEDRMKEAIKRHQKTEKRIEKMRKIATSRFADASNNKSSRRGLFGI